MEEKNQRSQSVILNKSVYALNDYHKSVLLCGLNFVPTPNWNNHTADKEQLNLVSHVRRVEWDHVLKSEEESCSTRALPDKLKLQKYNRPDRDLIEYRVSYYCNLMSAKLHSIKPLAKENFYRKNNLNKEERKALSELTDLVKNNKIVICRSDKDGKIIIVDFDDYN